MKQPIAVTLRRIRRWPLKKQHEYLTGIIAVEPPRSVRRIELEAAAAEIVMRDLKARRRVGQSNRFSEGKSRERINECA